MSELRARVVFRIGRVDRLLSPDAAIRNAGIPYARFWTVIVDVSSDRFRKRGKRARGRAAKLLRDMLVDWTRELP